MSLKDIAPILRNVSGGENLTLEEAEEAFDTCMIEDKDGYFFTALAMGLMAKGITVDELLGFYRCREKVLPKINVNIEVSKITDNSGTGGDKLKTFNVSSTTAFLITAADIVVAKQSFFAVTSQFGSGDLFRNFGIDVMKTSNPETIKNTLEKVGIVPFVTAFCVPPEKVTGTLGFIKKRNEIGLHFLTPFHLAANVITPIKIERRVYGTFDNKYSETLAQFLQRLDYKKGLIVHGLDGLDEVSNIGKTEIIEFGNETEKYTVSPSDFGIKTAKYEDIKAISPEQNTIDFLRILLNKDKGPKRDIVLMNAAASFYVMDKVSDLKDGVELAKKVLEEGIAADKLKKLVETIGDAKKFESWKKKI